jgi:hypothetical protein
VPVLQYINISSSADHIHSIFLTFFRRHLRPYHFFLISQLHVFCPRGSDSAVTLTPQLKADISTSTSPRMYEWTSPVIMTTVSDLDAHNCAISHLAFAFQNPKIMGANASSKAISILDIRPRVLPREPNPRDPNSTRFKSVKSTAGEVSLYPTPRARLKIPPGSRLKN